MQRHLSYEVGLYIDFLYPITGPAEAKLYWSGLSVQVPECEARGVWGHAPPGNFF